MPEIEPPLSPKAQRSERVLVAITGAVGPEALVRTGKQLAEMLDAPWSAIFVETPRAARLVETERQSIAEAMRLAASFGGDIGTTPVKTLTEGLRELIHTGRVTQVVIGSAKRSLWPSRGNGAVIDALLRDGGATLHVVPLTHGAAPTPAPRSTEPNWGALPALAAAIGLVAVTTLAGCLLQPLLGIGSLDLLYLMPVLAVAARFGRWPAIFTGAIAALAYDFFFLPPVFTLTVAEPEGIITLVMLVAVATVTAGFADRLRVRAITGRRGANDNAAVAAFGAALTREGDQRGTWEIICTEMAALLDRSIVLLTEKDGTFERVGAAPEPVPLGPIDRAAAKWTWGKGEPAGVGTATLTASNWQFHALVAARGPLAVIGIARGDGRNPIEIDRSLLLQTLLGQATLALERLANEAGLRQLQLLEERERMRTALLSSIGHDLRTPLTGMTAALDSLGVQYPDAQALPAARAGAARLRRFLDNLLDMVRIDTGAITARREAIDLTDAVSAALSELHDLLARNRIDLRVATDLPLVRCDPVLLHHILLNLLANAGTHGGSTGIIDIEGSITGTSVSLTIRDHGAGFPDEATSRMFEIFTRGKGSDRNGGSGLGHAIVKAFADVADIGVNYGNASGGGAYFRLNFPAR